MILILELNKDRHRLSYLRSSHDLHSAYGPTLSRTITHTPRLPRGTQPPECSKEYLAAAMGSLRKSLKTSSI
jgi:hypothetical protein